MNYLRHFQKILHVFVQDVAHGIAVITHNGLATLGIALLFLFISLYLRPDLREVAELRTLDWLEQHQAVNGVGGLDWDAANRATAINPTDLEQHQVRIAYWLSKKYRVAPEPVSALVDEAYAQGELYQIDPTLILAVMAIESNFNPYAQSAVGAQGLMQVMTKIHAAKYTQYGGELAAFDPATNLKVGVQVLRDCIKLTGSIEGGLRYYVGGGADNGGGYVGKVLTEQKRLQMVALGNNVPTNSSSVLSITSEKDATWFSNPFSH